MAALRVIALDGTTHATLLLAALRDLDEAIRVEAAYTLASVPWPGDRLPRVRIALIAKLVDTAPPVRRAAARSLGLLGPPPTTATTATPPTRPRSRWRGCSPTPTPGPPGRRRGARQPA